MLTHELPPRDDRSDNFRHLAGMIVAVAQHYDVTVDTITQQRWNDCLGLLREFDTLVDDYDVPHQQALAALRDFTPFAANYPSMRPEAVGGATHQIMVSRVERILQLGRTISRTTNPEEFIAARCEEVEQTAYLLADCAHGDTTTQPGFYTQFMPALCSMGRVALGEMARTGPRIAHRDVWRHFAAMGLARVRHRVRHGNQPYSSLHNMR